MLMKQGMYSPRATMPKLKPMQPPKTPENKLLKSKPQIIRTTVNERPTPAKKGY